MTAKIGLFFLKPNEYFPEGTLFELSGGERVCLPDGGDGEAVFIDRSFLLPCPEFAENVPPGQCSLNRRRFPYRGRRRTCLVGPRRTVRPWRVSLVYRTT